MNEPELVELDPGRSIWDEVHTVAPLVLVGSKEGDGYDLAPKHLAMPIGFDDFFTFACTPEHHTWTNIEAHREFTVNYLRPDSVVMIGQSAGARVEGEKLTLELLDTFPATEVDGIHLAGSYLHLECTLDRIVDGFGRHGLIIGRIVRAACAPDSVRTPDTDDAEQLERSPLLAFVSPNRFASVGHTFSFPFPAGFHR